MITAIQLYLYALCLYALAALASIILYSKPKANITISYMLCAFASLLAIISTLYVLIERQYPIIIEGITIPGMEGFFGNQGFFAMYLDALSLFLILVISLVTFYVSIFSIGYADMYIDEYSVAYLNFFYSLFVLSMILVVVANDVLSFYLSWEFMTFTSYMLVAFEHEKEEVQSASKVYLIIAHIGGACILLSFGILAFTTGSFSFDVFRIKSAALTPSLAFAVFALSLIGFGSKAGIVPLHAWLPLAHPAAPSNVSALLSGVMLKVAIYGLIRMIFDFLHPAGIIGITWGCIVLVFAALSTIIGVQFALVQHDLKRLLAYHSIENIGIILLGVGASIVLVSLGLPELACLALTAGLYHLLNHAIFKSLLFLGSGVILRTCRTRNFELLGGLSRTLKWTSVTFLIGAMAISGLPPFNGFASEWLTYQALLASSTAPIKVFPWISAIALFGAFMLGLAGALAVMCFTKVFGVTFLGPSGHIKPKTGENIFMKIGLVIPAIACIAFGIFIPQVTLFIGKISSMIFDATLPAQVSSFVFLSVSSTIVSGSLSLTGVAIVFTLATTGIGLILACRKIEVIKTAPWVSGVKYSPTVMKPTALAYASPIRSLFSSLYGVKVHMKREFGIPKIFAKRVAYEVELRPKIEAYARVSVSGPPYTIEGRFPSFARALEEALYKPFARPIIGVLAIRPTYRERITYSPIARAFVKLGELAKRMQAGKVYLYMLYILLAVIVLLILAVIGI